jgi:P4 family phage/plasmid primase-like protien
VWSVIRRGSRATHDRGNPRFPLKIEFGNPNKNIPLIYAMKVVKKPITVRPQSQTFSSTNYENYLKSHYVQKDAPQPVTNTRIGDKDKTKKIYGGSYHISDDEYLSAFLPLYAQKVFGAGEPEYLTEKQLDKNGPIYVDLDFHFAHAVNERILDKDYIDDLMDTYLDELKKIYQFDEDQPFQMFLMQKQSVNRLADKSKTKDGIHLLIGLQADRTVQIILRDRVMKEISQKWESLPIINTWNDVFDEGISIGYTNVQLFGSRKPDHDAYEITYAYNIQFNPEIQEFAIEPIKVSSFSLIDNIAALSVRNTNIPAFFMKNDFAAVYNQYKSVHGTGTKSQAAKARTVVRANAQLFDSSFLSSNMASYIRNIRSQEELDVLVDAFLENIKNVDYDVKEAHEYALALPPTYYEDGSYAKWIRVGWALKNTDDEGRLLISWIKMSSQAKNFKFHDIPSLCDTWAKMDMRKLSGGVTKRSLMHWVKQDVFDKYLAIRDESIDYYLEKTISGTGTSNKDKSNKGECGDWDLAKVLHVLYKDLFVCSSIKSNVWYHYTNNRWIEDETGSTLRKMISTEMRELYCKKTSNQLSGMMSAIVPPTGEDNNDDEQANIRRIRTQRVLQICKRLNSTSDKKNIMTEARDLFYDRDFLNKLDTNPYLLCFNNGVVDFKEKVFRKGRPDDYISKCTNIDYSPVDRTRDNKIVSEIDEFFYQLFPDKQLYNYMRDYLASVLIGTTSNQTFNMFIGGGSNGKSKLIDLMKLVLGDYKGEVPLSLVTGERVRIGGLSPEIVQLKGVRFAVMQEPEKGIKLNEGKMKELTGGDSIQARAPYMLQAVTFMPQFKLAVCSNTMMEIGSNDHGTWRRICVVPFESLFTETPVSDDPGKPYQFKIDKNIQEKFDSWKEIFAGILVEHAFKTEGIVNICDKVKGASNEYRQNQDFLAEFIRDKVETKREGEKRGDNTSIYRIRKKEVTMEFNNWYRETYGNGKGCPNPKDIHEYMDKQFGRQKNQAWDGVRIKYDNNEPLAYSDGSSLGDNISVNEL